MDVPDANRRRELEAADAKPDKLLSDSMLDSGGLRVVARAQFLAHPKAGFDAIATFRATTNLSERRVCAFIAAVISMQTLVAAII